MMTFMVIYRYIKEELHNTSSALAIIDEIEQRIMLLEEYPLTGNNAQEHELQTRGYRKLIINNCIALYTVDDKRKEVHIVRVFYAKRLNLTRKEKKILHWYPALIGRKAFLNQIKTDPFDFNIVMKK